MSYDDKARTQPPAAPAPGSWDSGHAVAPDPSLPLEDQLAWYKIATHVLLLNVGEPCRRRAAAEADKELERQHGRV
jgi:hypothetical protein